MIFFKTVKSMLGYSYRKNVFAAIRASNLF
jgi:hypothetical protein